MVVVPLVMWGIGRFGTAQDRHRLSGGVSL
jgi:hypothetical protein